jgi:hypothetical protein
MLQAADGTRLGQQAIHIRRALGGRREMQSLDRHLAIQMRIVRQVYFALIALAQ